MQAQTEQLNRIDKQVELVDSNVALAEKQLRAFMRYGPCKVLGAGLGVGVEGWVGLGWVGGLVGGALFPLMSYWTRVCMCVCPVARRRMATDKLIMVMVCLVVLGIIAAIVVAIVKANTAQPTAVPSISPINNTTIP